MLQGVRGLHGESRYYFPVSLIQNLIFFVCGTIIICSAGAVAILQFTVEVVIYPF